MFRGIIRTDLSRLFHFPLRWLAVHDCAHFQKLSATHSKTVKWTVICGIPRPIQPLDIQEKSVVLVKRPVTCDASGATGVNGRRFAVSFCSFAHYYIKRKLVFTYLWWNFLLCTNISSLLPPTFDITSLYINFSLKRDFGFSICFPQFLVYILVSLISIKT